MAGETPIAKVRPPAEPTLGESLIEVKGRPKACCLQVLSVKKRGPVTCGCGKVWAIKDGTWQRKPAVRKAQTKKPTIVPRITDITINVSKGAKANIGNYESMDVHVSKTEKWDVGGMDPTQAATFWSERYEAIQAELGEIVIDRYEKIHKGDL